jgi:hypothetical protein
MKLYMTSKKIIINIHKQNGISVMPMHIIRAWKENLYNHLLTVLRDAKTEKPMGSSDWSQIQLARIIDRADRIERVENALRDAGKFYKCY